MYKLAGFITICFLFSSSYLMPDTINPPPFLPIPYGFLFYLVKLAVAWDNFFCFFSLFSKFSPNPFQFY